MTISILGSRSKGPTYQCHGRGDFEDLLRLILNLGPHSKGPTYQSRTGDIKQNFTYNNFKLGTPVWGPTYGCYLNARDFYLE